MHDLPTHPTLTHPITGLPLVAIYRTRRGDLVWPQLGGAEDGDGDGDAGGDGASEDSKTADGANDGKTGPKLDGDLDKERAARAIAAAREGEKKAKAEAAAAKARTEAILKAAGLTPDGKEDPEAKLAAERAANEANATEARQTAIELAVFRRSGKAGGDPDALLDSREFMKKVLKLDHKAADFGDKVTEEIKAAVKAKPKLAAASTGQGSGSGRQGADHTGGSGTQGRPSSIREAYARQNTT